MTAPKIPDPATPDPTKTSAAAEAMHARVVAVSARAADLDMTEAQALRAAGMMRAITVMIRAGKSLIVMAGDDGHPAFYPSEVMITAMDDLDAALRPRPTDPLGGT